MKDLVKSAKPKLKPVTVNKAPKQTGDNLRNVWTAIMVVTKQVTVDSKGVIKKNTKRITEQQADIAWYLLAVPHHVVKKRYVRRTGITPTGILHVNSDTKLTVCKESVDKFVKLITGKKSVGYTAKTFTS